MSFILDALRKSDAERQRAVTPGLSDVRYATRRSKRNIWLPILVAVLAANAVFLAVQWLGRGEAPVAQSPPTAPGAAGTSPPAAVLSGPAGPAAPAADIRPLAREAEFGEPLLEPDVESEFAVPPGAVPAPVVMETAEGPPPVDPAAGLTPAPQPAAPPPRPHASWPAMICPRPSS